MEARYSVFPVGQVDPGRGALITGVLRRETGFLFDVNMSKTIPSGVALAMRMFAPGGLLLMSTGAGMPIDGERLKRTSAALGREFAPRTEDLAHLSPRRQSDLATVIIHTCLATGAPEQMRYTDPGAEAIPRSIEPEVPATHFKIGRNDPCLCGSSRKYKKCCGINAR